MGSLSILQGIFLAQELNQGLLHYRRILYQLSYQGSPPKSALFHRPILSLGAQLLFIFIRVFVTPWTVAHQGPLSMGFFRQEHWSGLLFPPLGSSQGLNSRLLCLLHSRWILWPLSILAISKIPLPLS